MPLSILAALLVLFLLLPLVAVSIVLARRAFRQRTLAATLHIASPHGVVDERYLPIGGIEQFVSIRGEDRRNPILLILHGGPGASCRIFAPLLRPWEKHFTLVQWDQRGSGKTLRRTGMRGSGPLTLDRLALDGLELTQYIHRQFPHQPLILFAQSFGSTFALRMIKQRPDLFVAYVGTDQNTGMVRFREQVHEAALARLRAARLRKGIALFERVGPDPTHWSAADYSAVSQWTMKSEPVSARRTFDLLKRSIWHAPGYSLFDIRAFINGMNFSLRKLLPDAVRFDAWSECTRFEIPFFLLQGEHDILTPPFVAEAYFNDIAAPVKAMSLIRNAGHFAAFLEPEQFLAELVRITAPVLTPAQSVVTSA